jgi:hypothetical protein
MLAFGTSSSYLGEEAVSMQEEQHLSFSLYARGEKNGKTATSQVAAVAADCFVAEKRRVARQDSKRGKAPLL